MDVVVEAARGQPLPVGEKAMPLVRAMSAASV
jgi:hypothetical protein